MHVMAQKSRHPLPAGQQAVPNSGRNFGPLPHPVPDRELGAFKAQLLKITHSRESAVAFLQRAGILDAKGRLAKPYRD